ncbi:MAG: KUP/HAK/KT family potassium transporter [Thermodesulfovibrionales bacterium]
MSEKHAPLGGIVKALGLVFGDIGTSPIYTLTVVFLILQPTQENVLGVLSLIIWTLITLVTVQYSWIAMNLSRRGEGGTIVLREILVSGLKSPRAIGLASILTFIGVSLLIGDGVITPAISILSAVEGALLIPGLQFLTKTDLVLASAVIAVVLFAVQSTGTERVAGAFGPIMILWFSSLAALGILFIAETPKVLLAVDPRHAFGFLSENKAAGFIALGEIILCATGGEALYADMGHLGSRPIRQAWVLVFAALVLNYLGQGAFLLGHPEAKNILFEMVFHVARPVYVPFLLMSICATIIASQAMISGMFSIVYQGITTRIMPMFTVDYTSAERRSQIYLGTVNWFMLVSVIFIMFEFRESSRLAAAYGLAVTGTMTLTGVMMTWIFSKKRKRAFALLSLFITVIDGVYLAANFTKIPHGGYWSLVLAAVPFALIILYREGQKRLYRVMEFMPLEAFLHKFQRVYAALPKTPGTALFLIKDVREIPFYIIQTMFYHGILYEENILVSILKRDDPYGVTGFFRPDLSDGLRVFEVQLGYMEVVDIEEVLRDAGIEERAVFYGLEDIITSNPLWKLFYFIKRNTPHFITFYKFPPRKLHGVLTKVTM